MYRNCFESGHQDTSEEYGRGFSNETSDNVCLSFELMKRILFGSICVATVPSGDTNCSFVTMAKQALCSDTKVAMEDSIRLMEVLKLRPAQGYVVYGSSHSNMVHWSGFECSDVVTLGLMLLQSIERSDLVALDLGCCGHRVNLPSLFTTHDWHLAQ